MKNSLGAEGLIYTIYMKLTSFMWFVGGSAAFLISAGTSFYVIENISPSVYFAILVAFAFDLVKVTSIFVERWAYGIKNKFINNVGRFLRLCLMFTAFVFCAIAISGQLLDKNQDSLITDKKAEITNNYAALVSEENKTYNQSVSELQKSLDQERNGTTERVQQANQQIAKLQKDSAVAVAALEANKRKEVSWVSADQYDGDTERAEAVRRSIRNRYDKKISDEKVSSQNKIAKLEKQLTSKEWYKDLTAEKKKLESEHNSSIKKLYTERDKEIEKLETTRFEGDERTQEVLITNFLKTVNRVFGTGFKYEQFIMFLVLLSSMVIEITIYYTFSRMALAALPVISVIREQKSCARKSRLEQVSLDLDFERTKKETVNDAMKEVLTDAKRERVLYERLRNFNESAGKQMKQGLENIQSSMSEFFHDKSNKFKRDNRKDGDGLTS